MKPTNQVVPYKQKPVLTYSPHPLIPGQDREVVCAEFLKGETIWAYLVRAGIAQRMGHQPFILLLDGYRLPAELWDKTRPKPGTLINICAIVRGGGGGGSKDAGKTLATIAVMVASWYVGAPVGTETSAGGLGYGMWASAAVAVTGSLVVSALFPFPKLPAVDQVNDSPTYAIEGGSNQMRRYEPMFKIIGQHRIFPDFGAQPYNEFLGNDQIGYYVFDFGYNDVVLSDIRIGDTPISSYSGVVMQESGPDGILTLFPDNVDTQAGAQLVQSVSVSRTSSVGSNYLAVELTGPMIDTNKGSIYGQVAGITIEYRKVGDAAWTFMDPDQGNIRDQIANFHLTQRAFNIGLATKYVLPDGTDASYEAYNINGTEVAKYLTAHYIGIVNWSRIPVRRTWKWAVPLGQYDVRVTRTTPMEDFEGSGVIELFWSQLRSYQPDTTDYNGRKRLALQITASGQLSGVLNQLNCLASARAPVWTGLTPENGVGKFMPGLLGMGWGPNTGYVKRETSNPAWWYLEAIRGTLIGPRGSSVSSFMPGMFGLQWPIPTRVWGAGQSDTRTDIDNIISFAQWCDAQTPPLTINGIFDKQMSVYNVLQAIALCGRATPSWSTGKTGVVWDAPNLPFTAVFGMHNILPGTFDVAYAVENLADMVEGWFINPDLNWQKDFVRVQVPGTTTASNITRVDLFGRTNRVLAAQDTNLYAAQNAYRNRRYKFQTDWEGMPTSRGDVIKLSHDLTSLDFTGRLVEGSTDSVLKLPRDVPLAAAGAFITVVKPDGTFGTYEVLGGNGLTRTLTLKSPLPFNPSTNAKHPPYDYKWLYGSSSSPGKLVKVEAWKPVNRRTIEITAVDEADYFYAAKDNPYTYVIPTPKLGAVSITGLSMSLEGIRAGTGYLVSVQATWTTTGDFSWADVRIGTNGGPLLLIAQGLRDSTYTFIVTDGSVIALEVTAYSSTGRLGAISKVALKQTISFASLGPPQDVKSFQLNGNQFSWSNVPDVDVVGYEIRFAYGQTAGWDTSAPLHDGPIAENPWTSPTIPSGLGPTTFLIKAVDAAGIKSVNAAIVIRDLGSVQVDNVVIPFDLKVAGWMGLLTGGTITNGVLVANTTTLEWDANASTPMWNANAATPMWSIAAYTQMVYEDFVIIPAELAGYRMLLNIQATGNPLTVEYRVNSGDAMWPDFSDAQMMWIKTTGPAVPAFMPGYEGMVWKADDGQDVPSYLPGMLGQDFAYMWAPFPVYQPWIGPITAEANLYEFRITVGQGATKGEIDVFQVLIDTPDLIQSVNLLSVPAAGIRIPLTEPFRYVETVSITLQHLAGQAVTAKWLDKSVQFGPLIQCFDQNSLPAAGTVNVLIQGY